MRRKERRWALAIDIGPIGVYAWPGGGCDDQPRTRTFRTRALARRARAGCCYQAARIVPVMVTIEPEEPRP